MPVEPAAADLAGAPAKAERILTRPLLTFLLLVGAGVSVGLWHKYPRPDTRGTAVLLADGDLDGPERRRQLARLVALADAAPSDVDAQWLGSLAAVRLEDRAAFVRFGTRLAPTGGAATPSAELRAVLGLGDPLLANVALARLAELAGDQTSARRHWQQVAEQCRLQTCPLAAELAAAALAKGR